ncbi:uncharacterized protein LOC62_02G002351 [Vanrija pseudolonga]|uniref:Uncharacterized protein n=1 Tax=Vanrija pseudolonga TaxID=143232 RepID=A0AAF0Y217_9TREE|nr:hypothetical protein LOC62_02G002351 [Vanrija pseudolonga]
MGANLEVFKFATYLFIPLFAMLHFGDPNWYEHHVHPIKHIMWPPKETTNTIAPKSADELHSELNRIKEEHKARRTGVAPSKPAAAATPENSAVLAQLPTDGKFDWAAGSKRLV